MKAPERIWAIVGYDVSDSEGMRVCTGEFSTVRGQRYGTEAEYIRADLVPQWEAALISEREDNLWNAFNEGHQATDGKWSHCFMSDGEWLAAECGFDPREGYYDAEAVKAAIPEAAKRVLAEVAPTPQEEG